MQVWFQLYGGAAPAGGYGDVTLEPGDATLKGFTLSLLLQICVRYQVKLQPITTFCQGNISPPWAGQSKTVWLSEFISLPEPRDMKEIWRRLYTMYTMENMQYQETLSLTVTEGLVAEERSTITDKFGLAISMVTR